MRNNERGRYIAIIYAFSMAICLSVMCAQVNKCDFSANAENRGVIDAISTNAEISESLSLKEKIEAENSIWGRFARAIWDMVEAWQG